MQQQKHFQADQRQCVAGSVGSSEGLPQSAAAESQLQTPPMLSMHGMQRSIMSNSLHVLLCGPAQHAVLLNAAENLYKHAGPSEDAAQSCACASKLAR